VEPAGVIELRPVDRSNWRDCARLRLGPGQDDLVASNVWSIAESRFEPHYVPRAVVAEDEAVGFLMYCVETDPPDAELYWLFRFMIDADHQGRGYGRAALRLAVDEMRSAGARRIHTMHRPRNVAASRLYRGAGFVEIGRLEDGDVELEKRMKGGDGDG
jgi:diamine N-acetyltransferase